MSTTEIVRALLDGADLDRFSAEDLARAHRQVLAVNWSVLPPADGVALCRLSRRLADHRVPAEILI